MEPIIITRTQNTEEKYLKRAQQLVNKSRKDLSIPIHDILDFRQFVAWLVDYKANINRNTWRQYKSAVVYYLETKADSPEAVEALEYLIHIDSGGCVLKSDKTSSNKLKKISYDDWQKLNIYLGNKRNKWYPELQAWLRSSIITGLRPVEWKTAKLIDQQPEPYLEVKNAKNTNGRSHGELRTLVLKNLTKEDLVELKTHLNNIKTFNGMGEYEYFYNGCAIALYKACRKIWPRRKKHITLYSTRHQFSSNAKSSGFSKAEVAAMMGHAVDITATIHYGKKQAGNEQIGIAPTANDVQKVKQIETVFYDHTLKNDSARKK